MWRNNIEFNDSNNEIINISENEKYIAECFEKDGIEYKEISKPEKIIITTEPMNQKKLNSIIVNRNN